VAEHLTEIVIVQAVPDAAPLVRDAAQAPLDSATPRLKANHARVEGEEQHVARIPLVERLQLPAVTAEGARMVRCMTGTRSGPVNVMARVYRSRLVMVVSLPKACPRRQRASAAVSGGPPGVIAPS